MNGIASTQHKSILFIYEYEQCLFPQESENRLWALWPLPFCGDEEALWLRFLYPWNTINFVGTSKQNATPHHLSPKAIFLTKWFASQEKKNACRLTIKLLSHSKWNFGASVQSPSLVKVNHVGVSEDLATPKKWQCWVHNGKTDDTPLILG